MALRPAGGAAPGPAPAAPAAVAADLQSVDHAEDHAVILAVVHRHLVVGCDVVRVIKQHFYCGFLIYRRGLLPPRCEPRIAGVETQFISDAPLGLRRRAAPFAAQQFQKTKIGAATLAAVLVAVAGGIPRVTAARCDFDIAWRHADRLGQARVVRRCRAQGLRERCDGRCRALFDVPALCRDLARIAELRGDEAIPAALVAVLRFAARDEQILLRTRECDLEQLGLFARLFAALLVEQGRAHAIEFSAFSREKKLARCS